MPALLHDQSLILNIILAPREELSLQQSKHFISMLVTVISLSEQSNNYIIHTYIHISNTYTTSLLSASGSII